MINTNHMRFGIICLISLFYNFGFGQSLEFESLRADLLADSEKYPIDLIEDRDEDCSTEFGGLLYMSDRMGMNAGASCAGSSCHSVKNHGAPTDEIQGGHGTLWMNGSIVVCNHMPLDYGFDIVDLNTPKLEGLEYKENVLSLGQIKKEVQPTENFGQKLHKIDWTPINEDRMMQHYLSECYNVLEGTEDHFVQAVMDYQHNAFQPQSPYAKWIETGDGPKWLKKGALMIDQLGCNDCHGGIGGVSDELGTAVLNSTGKSFTPKDSLVATRTWNESMATEYWFWNKSYVSGSFTGLSKHAATECDVVDDKEIKAILKWMERALNTKD